MIIKCLTQVAEADQIAQKLLSRVPLCKHLGVIALFALLAVHSKYIVKGLKCVGLLISVHAMIHSINNVRGHDRRGHMVPSRRPLPEEQRDLSQIKMLCLWFIRCKDHFVKSYNIQDQKKCI